jgi:hypothetical protein
MTMVRITLLPSTQSSLRLSFQSPNLRPQPARLVTETTQARTRYHASEGSGWLLNWEGKRQRLLYFPTSLNALTCQ